MVGMTLRWIGSLFLASTLLAAATPAVADPVCAKRDAVLKLLSHDFSEEPTAIGLLNTGGVMELLTSDTGSWTLIVTMPTGISCLIASGESWATKATAARGAPA